MGMRPTFDVEEKKGFDPLVDKTIGNAFKTVNYVAEHMDKLLAFTPPDVQERFVQSSVGLVGEEKVVPVPADIPFTLIRDSSVKLRDSRSQIFGESSGYFVPVLRTDGLHVLLKADAPLTLQNASILWTISYGVVNV